MRWLLILLALSGCVREGYVLRSLSVDASPRSVGFTVTFDNQQLPEYGTNCIGIEVCNETVE